MVTALYSILDMYNYIYFLSWNPAPQTSTAFKGSVQNDNYWKTHGPIINGRQCNVVPQGTAVTNQIHASTYSWQINTLLSIFLPFTLIVATKTKWLLQCNFHSYKSPPHNITDSWAVLQFVTQTGIAPSHSYHSNLQSLEKLSQQQPHQLSRLADGC